MPVELWKWAVELFTKQFIRILDSEEMPEECRKSVLVPILKNKGEGQSCSNYRGTMMMSHAKKLKEKWKQV